MEIIQKKDLYKMNSLRKYSFALRENLLNLIPDDSYEAFEDLLESKLSEDKNYKDFLNFLQMNCITQRKYLQENSFSFFNILQKVIEQTENDFSLLGYLLPLIDGILFGEFFSILQ